MVIIGSGLGGLLCGKILSEEGYKVCVLEKNKQIGGNLQTFVRDKVLFDTGVHYIGGLDKGQPLYKFFKYFGLMDNIKLERMSEDCFEIISFGDEPTSYCYGMGYDNFKSILKKRFPNESQAIDSYCETIQKICDSFPLYNVAAGEDILLEGDLLHLNAKQYFQQLTSDERLQNVLAATNVLYAGEPDTTPLYVHALVINSYILSSYRVVDGSSKIASVLTQNIRRKGGSVLNKAEVVKLNMDAANEKVASVLLKDERLIHANYFISNIHPAQLLSMLDTDRIRKVYRNRIASLKNTTSVLIANVVMKKDSFPYQKHNITHFETEDVWCTNSYETNEWPLIFVMYMGATSSTSAYAEGVTVMTYMRMEEVEQWSHTFNTTSHEDNRGPEYEEFKKKRAEMLFNLVEKKVPGFKNAIQSYTISTPLTYRDYIGTPDGSIYGISKDYNDPLRTFISPRTKVENLFITGQNMHMHGVYGVTVGAVKTCAQILGLQYLLNKIEAANQ